MMRHTLIALLACGCAPTVTAHSTTPTSSRGLRASEHLDSAREHDASARADSQWPDAGGERAARDVPWLRSWDGAAEDQRIAATHRGRAAELQADYDDACGTRTYADVSVSPLRRHAISGWNTSTGVIMYLSTTAGPADRLLADIRCHRAWMMLAPANMDECPLDMPGIQLDARGEEGSITVAISVRDPSLVGELQRRVALELEAVNHAAAAR